MIRQNKFKVFLDLDGVMVNLHTGLTGLVGRSYPTNMMPASDFHEYVVNMYSDVESKKHLFDFWADLPMLPNANLLFSRILYHGSKPTILTATPKEFPDNSTQNAATSAGKVEWAHRHLHPELTVITTRSNLKQKFIIPGEQCVLIDDYDANIKRWRAAGGIGILHTSVEQSIKELDDLYAGT